MPHQIMGEWALLRDLTHEHGDRAAHRLIDINDEHLVVISDKHCAPTTCRQYCPHLHLDHRFVHRVNGTRANMKNKRCSVAASLCEARTSTPKSGARTRTHSESFRKTEHASRRILHEVLLECDVSSHRFAETKSRAQEKRA